MLPAATSCSSGFHRCVRLPSISVTAALRRRPSLLPRRVASSSPPAPPPTMTIRCSGASTVLLVEPDVRQVLVGEMAWDDLPALHAGDVRYQAAVPDHRHAVGGSNDHALHLAREGDTFLAVGRAFELVVE